MPAVGPELPPYLQAKRKRSPEDSDEDARAPAPGAKRAKSPPAAPERRVAGPTLPPAPLDEMPPHGPDSDESSGDDSDDGYGPAPPGSGKAASPPPQQHSQSASRSIDAPASGTAKAKRDEWMMVPPKQDDLAARLDPTRPRPRGFNTGKSALTGSGGDDNQIWTETPEQKRKRLEEQVMGVARAGGVPATGAAADAVGDRARQDEERARAARIRDSRGKSLYDRHQKREDKEEEDDPSARAFDRERDMGLGVRIGEKQRRELMDKAADFGSKFSSGRFL